MFKRILFIFIIIVSILSLAVYAKEESDGYLFQFKDDDAKERAMEYLNSMVFLMDDEETVSEVYEPVNLYKSYDEDLLAELYEMGFLEYYEPNAVGYLMDYDYTLDRYYLSSQSSWAHKASNALGVWKYGVYGNDVNVAVIDSGINPNHEDLADCVLPGYSFVDSDGNGRISETEAADYTDKHGHGTFVSGVIAAQANGKGVVGIAHRAKIIPIKITDKGRFSTAELANSVYKAVELGADVINMSLGVSSNLTTLNFAIKHAQNQGIIVVAASGNVTSYTQGTLVYPAYNENVISVGNLAHSGDTYFISSQSIANAGVTICAPGTSVYSTHYGGTYGLGSGTSFACPYVAGIAALAKSIEPDITPAEFMQILKDTARKDVLNGAVRTNEYGYGIADAGAVVEEMIKRNESGGFISPVDKTATGGVNVKIHNPESTEMTYSFAAKVENAGRPVSLAYKTVTLAPGGVAEIPLAYLNGAFTGKVKCYLLDAKRFAPVYNKVEG